MRKGTIAAIQAHALAEYPRECVGFVVHTGRAEKYLPGRNIALNPECDFLTAPEDFAAAEDFGEIVAFVHSHPGAPARPSESDLIACEASRIPWAIISVMLGTDGKPTPGEIYRFEPSGYLAPLVGRPFYHGVLDCYAIVRDYYQRERGVALPDFPREDKWWERGQNLYLDHYVQAGFRRLSDGEAIAVGDVILMQVRADSPNHAGVFIGRTQLSEHPDLHPVADGMLHHLYGQLSTRVPYGGYWQEVTRLVLRHADTEKQYDA